MAAFLIIPVNNLLYLVSQIQGRLLSADITLSHLIKIAPTEFLFHNLHLFIGSYS